MSISVSAFVERFLIRDLSLVFEIQFYIAARQPSFVLASYFQLSNLNSVSSVPRYIQC